MKLRFVPASVAVALLAMAPPLLHSQTPYPDWTIYGPAPVNGSTLTISASWSHAGAITSLKLGNEEFVDNTDHGRQIQSAIQLNGRGEYYNPNEAGTLDDTDSPWSTSDLLGLSIPSSNRLMTMTDMAYWFVKNSQYLADWQKNLTIPPANAAPDGQFTQFWLQKDVTIAPAGLPGNVIEYLSTFQPTGSPPEAVTSSIASTPAVYLKPSLFTEVWTYDLATRTLLQNRDAGGEDDMIKVMKRPSSPMGPLALTVYKSENLQPYGDGSGSTFGWWLIGPDPYYPSTFLNPSNHASGPLPVSYRSYLVVGNPNEVTSSLDALDLKFASLDPDVFSWREYIRLNPDFPQTWTQADAQNHWLVNGINEGRTASYRFALGRYRDLNSDQWAKTNQEVINHFIQYGRKEGRSTTPRPEGGSQHTIVRSPQPDFVPIRASGANSYGQLGNGSTTLSPSPVQLPHFGGENRVTDVASGDFTSFAVLSNGAVWMWGSNQNGARGNGSVGGQNNSPVQVPYLPPIVVPSTKDRHVVAAGQNAYAVVDTQGCVWTWGYGGNGQLGNGSQNSRYTPGKVQKDASYGGGDLTGIVSVSVGGANNMAALDIDGHVWTWGYNGYGQLGNNTTIAYSATAVKAVMDGGSQLAGITQVVAGGTFCLALQRNGVIWAWGYNAQGQLGDTTYTLRRAAVAVHIPLCDGKINYIDKIAAGSYHGLAHSGCDGKVWVWGYNGYGQLGLPPGYPVYNPAPIALAEPNIIEVAAGNFFSLITRAIPYQSERNILGFGDNQSGQLGVGDRTTRTTPALTQF